MNRIVWSIWFLLLLSSTSDLFSQHIFQQKEMLNGMIACDSTGRAIFDAHIYNESRRTGTISNLEGYYNIPAGNGDTLVFSALGYYSRVWIVKADSLNKPFFTISLKPRFYEIEAVKIKSFRDYKDFQMQFLALELPKTQTDQLRDYLQDISRNEAVFAAKEEEAREALGRSNLSAITLASVPILTKEDKQRINYEKVLEHETILYKINKKYNREIITKVTSLTSQDEITDFMGYCNFTETFLLYASEYDILLAIERKYKEYLQKKEKGDLLNVIIGQDIQQDVT